MVSFQIVGLSPEPFAPLFALDDETLRLRGAIRMVADSDGFPCRVSLRDAAAGDELLLLHYEHQTALTPYRASHAIFVGRDSQKTALRVNEVAPILANRLLSVRAFDQAGLMVDADVCQGNGCADLFNRMLEIPEVSYLHAHTARRGCYLARVDRV